MSGVPNLAPETREYLAEISKTRMRNLRRQVASFHSPSVKNFCRETGMDYGNAMKRITGKTRITEEMARNLEFRLKLPFGELDK